MVSYLKSVEQTLGVCTFLLCFLKSLGCMVKEKQEKKTINIHVLKHEQKLELLHAGEK